MSVPRGIFGNYNKIVEKIRKSGAKYALCNTLDAVCAAKEAGVETVSAFSSDGTLAGTFGDSITKNEDGTYTYTVYRPINLK